MPPFGSHDYNYVSIEVWTYFQGAVHNSAIWKSAVNWFTSTSQFGSTTNEIQKSLRTHYHNENKKILITAFGNEVPASHSVDPVVCAQKLATFVLENNLDGVNVDWKDLHSFIYGTGENWMISFMTELRVHLPDHVVCHTADSSYFKEESFTNGGYIAIHEAVGHLIDFYNVQYFQAAKTYD